MCPLPLKAEALGKFNIVADVSSIKLSLICMRVHG